MLAIDSPERAGRGGNKNKLGDENRARVLEAFSNRTDVEYFARLVDNREIADNDYNIAVSSCRARRYP